MNSQGEIEVPFHDFSQRYRLIRKIKDSYGRDYNVVKDMRTQRRAIVKAYVVDSQEQEESILTSTQPWTQTSTTTWSCERWMDWPVSLTSPAWSGKSRQHLNSTT